MKNSNEELPNNQDVPSTSLAVHELMALLSQCSIYQKKVLTLDEVVAYTGFKRSYLLELTSTGRIPHSKPTGRFLFFDREKIETWLLENSVKTTDEIEHEASRYLNNKQIINVDKRPFLSILKLTFKLNYHAKFKYWLTQPKFTLPQEDTYA